MKDLHLVALVHYELHFKQFYRWVEWMWDSYNGHSYSIYLKNAIDIIVSK